jgi:hypothetical protein
MPLRRLVLLTASVVVALGCNDKEAPLSPKLVPTLPHSQIVPPSMSDVALPVGGATNPAYTVSLPTYQDTLIVEFRLNNTISVHAESDAPLQGYSGALDGAGEFVGGVWQACYARVQFVFSLGRSGPAPCYMTPIPASQWVDTVLVAGQGTASRNIGVPENGPCLHGPCHTYSGQQLVSVTPIAALLELSASSLTHVPGGTITFRASVSPDTMHHITVPLKMMSWAWTPLDTGQNVACATPVNPCTTIILADGSMKVTALANGAEQFRILPVSVITWDAPNPCPGGVINGSHPKSSQYGRMRPQIGENYPHTGDDFDVSSGTDVLSPRDGTISAMNSSRTAGKMIIVTSDSRYSWFLHLSSFNPALHVGSPVSVGTWLGKTGNTGHSTNPHLHFEEHTKDGPMTIETGERQGHAPQETLVPPCTF